VIAMKTRAAVYVEFQKPLVVEEIELPDPGPTQLLIKQFATGICHSQLHALHNPKTATPRLMGHESTGVVVSAGSEVTHVKEGDHVMVTWVQRNATRSTPRPTSARSGPAPTRRMRSRAAFGSRTTAGRGSRRSAASSTMPMKAAGSRSTGWQALRSCCGDRHSRG
jgi:hypothetical protein